MPLLVEPSFITPFPVVQKRPFVERSRKQPLVQSQRRHTLPRLADLDGDRSERPLTTRCYPLVDYMPAAKGASYVSTAFKALVEQFEPGVHQFFEMSVKSGKKDVGPVFYFVVANRIDALDHAACVPPIGPNNRLYTPNYDPDDKILFSKSKICSAHIWSEKREIGIFMSDAFRDALFQNGLTDVKDSVRYEETP